MGILGERAKGALAFLFLLLLAFSAGCVESQDCSYFLQEEHYSYSGFVGCKTKEAVALAVEGDTAGAVEACREILELKRGSVGSIELKGYEEYNNCITQVAVVTEDVGLCSHTEENALMEIGNVVERMAELIPFPSQYQGVDIRGGSRRACERAVENEMAKREGLERLWQNIMAGFGEAFSRGAGG